MGPLHSPLPLRNGSVITKGLDHFLKVQRVVYQGQQFGIDHSSDYTLKATVPLPLSRWLRRKMSGWQYGVQLQVLQVLQGTPRHSKVLQGTPRYSNKL